MATARRVRQIIHGQNLIVSDLKTALAGRLRIKYLAKRKVDNDYDE